MRRQFAVLGAIALIAAGLAAPAQATAAPLAGYYGQRLDWQPCAGSPGFECATFVVPRDYSRPEAGDFRLPVIKKPAGDPAHRIGSLILDPGGPGDSGLADLPGDASSMGASVLADFDIVSWDRRGIEGSDTTLTCMDTAATDAYTHLDPAPSTHAGVAALVKAGRNFTAACRANSAPGLLGQIGSIANARDMDILRAVLGDSKMNYFGYSYGSFQGLVYAELFPGRIRTMAVDGIFDPSLTGTQMTVEGALSEESELQYYADVCNTTPGVTCPASTPAGIMALIDKLQQQVKTSPLPAQGTTRTVGPNELATALRLNGIAPGAFYALTGPALSAAAAGDGTQLLGLADTLNSRAQGAPGPVTGYLDSFQDDAALFCVDRPWPSGTVGYGSLLAAAEAASPHLGAERATMALPCGSWPTADFPHAVRAPGTLPILVVSSTGDPVTPYQWGVRVADTLANGVLLTSESHGHTAYGSNGSACLDAHVDDYLVNAAPPPPGTAC
ncbi:alpha/beta fold hydrolase [Catenulispora sp. NL8]|uniref:Alpha/beta fold hydrolase n=1 Tax=Catenulispora pinistramenti TaxID=2705254 RepID=A0ABS5L1E2_9ACTN|nr:alpha/beta hydrolase [Catenulispora pinistramenti]MBS2552147.1 alpha/beta fold hydrolase [Catenulispora pinistramenti]